MIIHRQVSNLRVSTNRHPPPPPARHPRFQARPEPALRQTVARDRQFHPSYGTGMTAAITPAVILGEVASERPGSLPRTSDQGSGDQRGVRLSKNALMPSS
jgi:hypothetical protein